ncbi:Regulator of chromosome condensation [Macleaya cordata]|uniref:Regulator of chromosome condensation n=1 Tax=Macleaya cordata TaxID=56857 RepID=A0A200PQ36_MACCD|nr:Regulator of chromosome condensation [Macleaya cordata]
MEETERTKEEEEEEERERRTVGEVWSWGAGTDGQLGTARLQDEHLPQLLLSLDFAPKTISQLACGGAHVIALTGNYGKVLTWGRGTSGQLGHGDLNNCLHPKPVKLFETLPISHVSAGWNHSGFVSDNGRVFTCGDGSFGQLGHGDYQSHYSPVEVSFLGSKNVNQIACGMRHSLVLLKGQSGAPIYGFGSGKHGQLGVSNDRIRRSFNLPEAIMGFEDVEILAIIANGDHSAALTADGHLYTWGRGFSGSSDAYHPQLLSSPLNFTQVALGWNHALLLTDKREVFMLGGKHHGLLSDPQKMTVELHSPIQGTPYQSSDDDKRVTILAKVPDLNGIKVVQVAAGSEHSALVTVAENGDIMTWGWGEHGQLGLGDTCDQMSPRIVCLGDVLPAEQTQLSVYCGSGFTFAIKSERIL